MQFFKPHSLPNGLYWAHPNCTVDPMFYLLGFSCFVKSKPVKQEISRTRYFPLQRAVVVAQLVERSLPIPEVRGSNPVISQKFILNFTVNCIEKKKKVENSPSRCCLLIMMMSLQQQRLCSVRIKSISEVDCAKGQRHTNYLSCSYSWINSLLF